jgi:hypothetical protein
VTKEERAKVEKLAEKDGKTIEEIKEWKQSYEAMSTHLS